MRRGLFVFFVAFLFLSASCFGFYENDNLRLEGDLRLKLVAIDELPLDAGVKLPELNYSDVVGSLRADWQYAENIEFRLWLKSEFRNYATNKDANNYRFLDEFVFHQLSVEFVDLVNGRLDLSIGRFPLYYGRGLLILESSPLDAERSYGFNGIKAHLKFDDFVIDLIGLYLPAEDELLINNKHKETKFIESDERGFVAYMQNKNLPWLPRDMYYMFKHEEPRFGMDDISFHTLGFIIEKQTEQNFTVYWELARQLGRRSGGGDTRGWLSDFSLSYRFSHHPWRPEFFISNYYLSGDDPSTRTEEGWHGLWARWPQYSYLLVWSFIPKIGDWSNLNWSRVGVKFEPAAKHRLEINVGPVRAPRKGPGGGKKRGELLIVVYSHQLTPNLSVSLRAETLYSDNYFPDTNNLSWESRLDIKYRF